MTQNTSKIEFRRQAGTAMCTASTGVLPESLAAAAAVALGAVILSWSPMACVEHQYYWEVFHGSLLEGKL